MTNRPLVVSLASCALAAVATIAFLFVAEHDPRPHHDVFDSKSSWVESGGLILWAIAPYLGLALLAFLVRNRAHAARYAAIVTVMIALPALILVSPLIHEDPTYGWFDFSWNGRLPFMLVPVGQWILFVFAAIVVGAAWLSYAPRLPRGEVGEGEP
jgi:hypothetical protein